MECMGKRTTFFRELRGEEPGWGTGETNDIGLLEGDWWGVGFLNPSLLRNKRKDWTITIHLRPNARKHNSNHLIFVSLLNKLVTFPIATFGKVSTIRQWKRLSYVGPSIMLKIFSNKTLWQESVCSREKFYNSCTNDGYKCTVMHHTKIALYEIYYPTFFVHENPDINRDFRCVRSGELRGLQ